MNSVNYNEIELLNKVKKIIDFKSMCISDCDFNDCHIVFMELANTAINKFRESCGKHSGYLQNIISISSSDNIQTIEEFISKTNNKEINNYFSGCNKLFDMAIKYYEDNLYNIKKTTKKENSV